jgi:S1-C subfamily serine protease
MPAAALFAIFSLAAFPAAGVAGEDAQAELESRRIEGEARRQQEMVRRELEGRERAQAEALRGQEEAIRRMEATRSRIEANAPPALGVPLVPALPPIATEVHAYPDLARRDDAISGMRFAPLTERLGSYFGTTSGVLVVRAGANAPFGLQDGDVILSIHGRVPTDDQHAAGILRSYQPGERVQLRVQRDRRVIDIDTTAPGQRSN